MSMRSFGTGPGNGSIIASATSFLDVTGDTSADGTVQLTARLSGPQFWGSRRAATSSPPP